MALTYEIFELEISSIRRNQYHSSVIGSAGEARAAFQLPFSGGELELRLKDLEIALLRSSGVRRQILRPEEQTVQNFGRELFDALITGEIRSRYDVSQERARREGKGLRIKLRIQASDLAVLPWEFLFDSRANEFVCLSRYTPLVRYLELPQPVPPLAVTPPLRILALIASPSDLPPLDVAAEKARVEEALHPLRKRGLVELTWLEGQSWRVVQRAMRSGTWHVFHFVGHGGYDAQRDEG